MKIEGQVTDPNGKPLSGVNIEFYDGSTVIAGARSGSDGRFRFENDSPFPGRPVLAKASAKGYLSAEQEVLGDAFSGLTIALQPAQSPTPVPIAKYATAVGVIVLLGGLLFFFLRGRPDPEPVVNSAPADPELGLEIRPERIRVGETATLIWRSKNADTVQIRGFGRLPTEGTNNIPGSQVGSHVFTGFAIAGEKFSATNEVVLHVFKRQQAILQVKAIGMTPTRVQARTPVELTVTVGNIGDKASSEVKLQAWAITPNLSGATDRIPNLRPTTIMGQPARTKKVSPIIDLDSTHARFPVAVLANFTRRSVNLSTNLVLQPGSTERMTFSVRWPDLTAGTWTVTANLLAGDAYVVDPEPPQVASLSLTVQ